MTTEPNEPALNPAAYRQCFEALTNLIEHFRHFHRSSIHTKALLDEGFVACKEGVEALAAATALPLCYPDCLYMHPLPWGSLTNTLCGADDHGNYSCTRQKGHEGEHVACSVSQHGHHRWPPAMVWASPDDQPLPEDEEITAAHPVNVSDPAVHAVYQEALRLVGARRSKYGLVNLVHWLLWKNRKESTP